MAFDGLQSSTASSLDRSIRVMGALVQREAMLRRRKPWDTIFHLLEPLFIIFVFTFSIWFFEARPAYGTSTILFLTTGLIPHYLFIQVARKLRITRNSRRFPVETALHNVFVKILYRLIDYFLLSLVVFSIIYFFSTEQAAPSDFSVIFASCVALITLGFGIALVNAAIAYYIEVWDYIWPAVARMMLLFGGLRYVTDFLPEKARYVVSFNPLNHAVLLFRMGFYPEYPHSTLDIGYLVGWCLGAVCVGLVVERNNRH